MWNKLSIRTKITLLTATVLCFISLLSFIFNIENASTIFILTEDVAVPFEDGTDFQLNWDIAQRAFRINSFYIMVFFSIAGTFLMWWVSGRVLKPLNKFSNRIKELDINKINDDIKIVKSSDEVGDLQNAFNYMLKNIRDSYESQKRFSQNAAHELKTPVAAIKANLEVLNIAGEASYDEYKEFASVVERQVEMMNAVVQGLRLLSSGEKLNPENFYIYKEVKGVLQDLNDMIMEKDQKVEVSFEDQNICIKADRILMRQFNLIHNAVRYSKKDERIEINQKGERFTVKNYGVGISKDNLEKIFEAFYCVDRSRSKKIGGSGLGLAITKEIVERHGFLIRADSVEDNFVEFTIDFTKKDIKKIEKGKRYEGICKKNRKK